MEEQLDFRKIIIDSLEKSGKSRYWLAGQVANSMAANTVYRYLRGELDITSEPLAVLLRVLGMDVVEVRKAVRRKAST